MMERYKAKSLTFFWGAALGFYTQNLEFNAPIRNFNVPSVNFPIVF